MPHAGVHIQVHLAADQVRLPREGHAVACDGLRAADDDEHRRKIPKLRRLRTMWASERIVQHRVISADVLQGSRFVGLRIVNGRVSEDDVPEVRLFAKAGQGLGAEGVVVVCGRVAKEVQPRAEEEGAGDGGPACPCPQDYRDRGAAAGGVPSHEDRGLPASARLAFRPMDGEPIKRIQRGVDDPMVGRHGHQRIVHSQHNSIGRLRQLGR
mmetsp:Transcript_122051/g.352707  ORF Transcript_122051/g.352707 Transcript_122051/m.352707 type:complete len:211 (-) Transcript_122051:525-1157(-)